MKQNIQLIMLMVIILLGVSIHKTYLSKNSHEGYSNYTLDEANGKFPNALDDVLVQDTYPITGINGITNNGSNDIWWWYPTFKLGSYAQITNNIRYPRRTTDGRCMPASMCGSLYKEKYTGDNHVYALPPVNNTCGTRVGYFTSSVKSLVLPFKPEVVDY